MTSPRSSFMDSDSESKLISLMSQLIRLDDIEDSEWESKIIPLIVEIISLVRSMDSDSQPKPESKLMSLVTQAISLFNSIDLDSLPKPLSKLISFISQKISIDSDQKPECDLNFTSLVNQTLELLAEPELVSLIRQIVSLVVVSLNSKLNKLIFLCPEVEGYFDEGKFCAQKYVSWKMGDHEWSCFIGKWEKFRLTGEDFTHFRCSSCDGRNHELYEKAPLAIKHPLHQKHYLQLAQNWYSETRKCYCCDEDLIKVFYYCLDCDFAMNIACVEKAPVLYVPPPKWHEHTLALFPRRASLTCNVCALADLSSPIYMCSPCDFVIHLRCINLPRVIMISRHPHRISFTPSFDQGDWSCSVCRKEINNDYGGYSCNKDGCLYAVHSRCATQSNVWDGIDLEGKPEDIEEEEVEPFVRISDGIIRHFSHEHHHLRLDENTCRDYNDKQCQACIMPIYFGNFYSCVQCEFVLHERCVNLSRKMYHPTHPHLITLALAGGNDNVVLRTNRCSVCYRGLTAGFFYECSKVECNFRLHVQCSTIFEPLVHASHGHPLFLTSKPGERRRCCVCLIKDEKETFNCIECDSFALCFKCAATPQNVRYKHDKHILTLSYGEKTSTITTYWCDACERKINPRVGFYMCDEYCCATLHIECLTGKDLYMKPGSSFFYGAKREDVTQVSVLSNNHHMTRPICSKCKNRCPHKIVILSDQLIFCSLICCHDYHIDCTMITRVPNAIA